MVDRDGVKRTSDSKIISMEQAHGSPEDSGSETAVAGDTHRASYAPQVWRLIFVTALIALGAILGLVVGEGLVNGARESVATGSFISAYKANVQNEVGAIFNELAFALLGGLMTYLLATAVFKKVVDLGEGIKSMSAPEKIAIFTGLAAGLLLTAMLSPILLAIPKVGIMVTIVVAIMLAYLGIVAALSMKDELHLFGPAATLGAATEATDEPVSRYKVLDTNVIIDGRISDICRTGFIEGPVYVPGFVLDELQHIADSSDALKRARGRRGLDILNQMRSEMPLIVRSLDIKADYQGADEVDAKLVKLAKKLEGVIVTNDFNLNKVAELQGVPVFNINELANALKPVVLPGEEMHVTVIKEGKEMNQGIAYLDDGTMIVIEGARRRIGENLDVVVSSVLQTVAGKMIFATIRQEEETEDDGGYDQGARGYTSSRPRRPFR